MLEQLDYRFNCRDDNSFFRDEFSKHYETLWDWFSLCYSSFIFDEDILFSDVRIGRFLAFQDPFSDEARE